MNEHPPVDQPLRFVALDDVSGQLDKGAFSFPPVERPASATSATTHHGVEESWSPFADSTWAIPPPNKLLTEISLEPPSSLFAVPYEWQQSIAQHNSLAAAPVLSAATKVEQDAMVGPPPTETVRWQGRH